MTWGTIIFGGLLAFWLGVATHVIMTEIKRLVTDYDEFENGKGKR